jgi:hypothetical protein
MNLDVDYLIGFFNKHSHRGEGKEEMGEQDAAAGGSSSGGGAKPKYPTVTKWETGLSRGLANTIDPKSKWNSLYTIKRGKGNTLI